MVSGIPSGQARAHSNPKAADETYLQCCEVAAAVPLPWLTCVQGHVAGGPLVACEPKHSVGEHHVGAVGHVPLSDEGEDYVAYQLGRDGHDGISLASQL